MPDPDRLHRLVRLLRPDAWRRAADLAADLGVSPRTIYRDVRALHQAGIPVVAVGGKGYRLDDDYLLPPVAFTADEAAVLRQGLRPLARHGEAAQQATARSARAKLDALLPSDKQPADADPGLRLVPVQAFTNPSEQAHLAALRRAVDEQRVVTIRHRGGSTERLHPYGLFARSSGWYVLGFSAQEARVRSVPVAAVEAADVLDERFDRPASYAGTAAQATGLTVHVVFAAEMERWVREAPPAFVQEMTTADDGLHVTAHVQDDGEILPWLLSWGPRARVLGPASLQRRLAQEAAGIQAQYATAPTLLS